MINPFEWNVDWRAVATLIAGIAAVSGALLVARRQNQLRKDEVRIALFDRRRDALVRFDRLSGNWWQNARLAPELQKELRELVRDVELLFDGSVHKSAEVIFKDTIFQDMFMSHREMFIESGNLQDGQRAFADGQKKFEAIAERLPQLRQLLVDATKVGTIFR